MAKREKALSESFRARGVRKKVADELARAANGSSRPRLARRAASDLATVVAEIQHHLDRDGASAKRSASAKKAAATRGRKARLRSQSAKKAARTRARG